MTDDRSDPTDEGEAFDRFVAPLDPAMVIVTTVHDGERSGCLVGFHGQSSIEPRRHAVWLSKANHTYGVALRAELLAVHVVDVEHRGLAELFGSSTGDEIDKFARCAWTPGPGGVPLLDDLSNRLVGRRVTILDDGGDHVCITLDPQLVEGSRDLVPIRASELADLDPGHDAEDID
jgi:flavin reductase (DIM6/NTAB) family NADH-FMN oxidoreductase RutF